MSYSPQLQFCSPKLYLHPLLKSNLTRLENFQVFCSPSHHDSQRKERGQDECAVILVERYGNGTSKRYVMDNNERITTYLQERDNSELSGLQSSLGKDSELFWIPQIIKDFFLPAGFPETVSDDYLDYILWQFPTNVTGWICHVLVTSSLLKAVGVGSVSGTTAAASAAAIRWVSKDGIGAVGRLLIGGRFGSLFDDDPKQWRMYADFIGSAGSIFDLCTPLYPGYFLPLASLGNLAKAVARGLKDPSFRVIQNHFAIAGNLGEVAAKEEVWEVSAQLIGLALGIYALDSSFISTSYPTLASTWLTMRLLHLWFRYMSLSVIQFDTINLKRARILVQSHISSTTVPGCKQCNAMENILLWQRFIRPSIVFSVSLEEMVGGQNNMIKTLLQLFANESYVLMVNRQQLEHFEVLATFKDGATSLSVLRSVWQSYWLHQNASKSVSDIKNIEQSLVELDDKFSDFIQRLKEAGWETKQLSLKVPKEISIHDLILDSK